MLREWLLLIVSAGATVILGIVLLRWLAPGLLGLTPGLEIVQLSDEVAPFYENVFRPEDAETTKFILKDPRTIVRAQPLRSDEVTGPTDVLGFRNPAVPNRADVIAIGDSQTFGLNVPMAFNWPNRLAGLLGADRVNVYSMATGGWGGVQYLDMFDKALAFRPSVVIVAYYSGNDAMESFRAAYAVDAWNFLRPNPDLTAQDRPPPPPLWEDDKHEAVLQGGAGMIFTPGRRFYAIREHPVVDAGWQIMAEVGRRIARSARAAGVRVVFTIIPTKELIHAPRLQESPGAARPVFEELVEIELRRIEQLGAQLAGLDGAVYVDLVEPLRRSVRQEGPTHLGTADGHPKATGYAAIARALAGTVAVQLGKARAAHGS